MNLILYNCYTITITARQPLLLLCSHVQYTIGVGRCWGHSTLSDMLTLCSLSSSFNETKLITAPLLLHTLMEFITMHIGQAYCKKI